MTRNVQLINAMRQAGLSEERLARRVQQAGHRLGYPNGCNRATVHRWTNGTQPQPHYVIILEDVLGQPAASLGIAYAEYGMDADRLLGEARLDISFPEPEPSAHYGSLTGIWLSRYEYPSTSRGGTFSGQHYVQLLQRGAHLNVRSLPKQHSLLSMDFTLDGQIATGTWTERTSKDGYYKGAIYHGGIQVHLDPTGRRLEGQWVGFGRDGQINNGPWSLTLVEDKVDRATREKWDRAPGPDQGKT
jgi:hypothetical protein